MDKTAYGTFSSAFRLFYRSSDRITKITYDSIDEATRAQRAMLNLMNREKVFNVIIVKKRNVIMLEKDRIKHEAECERFRTQVMQRFLQRD